MLPTIPRWRLAWCALSTTAAVRRPMTATVTRTWTRMLPRTMATRARARAAVTAPTNEPPIQLRDYQEACIQAVLAALARGQTRVGISLATGAGKTVIFTQLVDRVHLAAPPGAVPRTQTLILAHRRELVEQAARHCMRAYPGKTVEVEMGNVYASGGADITVASVQSLVTGTGHRLAKFDARRFKLVLVDEAHHIVASGYMRTLAHFGLAARQEEDGPAPARPVLVGVSATFSRFDGLKLSTAIDEIVYHRDYVDMIGKGWLSDVVFTTVASTVDLSKVRSTRSTTKGGVGDFRTTDLSHAVNTPEVNDITVRTWLQRARPAAATADGDGGDRHRRATLVFCVDRSHVADLTAAFRRHGVDAQAITGDTNKTERAQRLDAFQRGAFPVLLNCGVFTEGTDLPTVDCVVLARPTRSRNLLVQMIGRGLRRYAGKTNCHVIDMVASLATGIVTTPTLFGLDPDTLLEAASVSDMRAIRAADKRGRQRLLSGRNEGGDKLAEAEDEDADAGEYPRKFTNLRITDYASVLDLITDTAGERHIRRLSPHAWVLVGEDRYVLCGPTGTYLRIKRLDEGDRGRGGSGNTDGCTFHVVEVRALPRGVANSPFAAPQEVCRAPSLEAAVRGADHYASKVFPWPFIHRYQGWRRNQATQGQRNFLERVGGGGKAKQAKGSTGKKKKNNDAENVLPADVENVLPADLTCGDAADMITKIKHGARGRFADLAAQQRRRVRATADAAAHEQQWLREEVTVGPLGRD